MRKNLSVFILIFTGAVVSLVAQDTTITYGLLPKFVGGSPTALTTLEQPIAVYFTVSGLEANTDYNQAHMGFLTKGTTSVRGSKWTPNGWISPSTVLFYKRSDAEGKVKGWAFLRTPSSYIVGTDTSQIRLRLQKVGTSTNITFDSQPLTSLNIAESATGNSAGAIIYGYLDSLQYGGSIIVAYGDTGSRPLSSWFVLTGRDTWTNDFFSTRMDTLLRKGGYFQLVVPTNQKIAKLEIRDTLNDVKKTWMSDQWISGGAGSKTEINFALSSVSRFGSSVPEAYVLQQNYPNPFNPSTTIRFSVLQKGFVALKIHDLLGKEIMTLVNEELNNGTYVSVWDAGNLPSGIYIYTMRTNGYSESRKMMLLR